MGRAPCCDKANVKKGPWSVEEDAKLKAYIEEHGTGGNWIALPQKIGLKRCGKSCRLRWLNYLRPNIKHGGFTEEEDQIICSLYISIGSRWSIIAAQLPGRTDNDIKNYWNTRLKKKLLGKKRVSSQSRRLQLNSNRAIPNEQEPNGAKDEEAISQTLNASAMERMQLHMQLQGLYSSTDPFCFYNSPAALWPKFHPLSVGDDQIRVPENQRTNSDVASSLVPQAGSSETPIGSTVLDQVGNPNLKHETSTVQEEALACTGLGFQSSLISGGSLSIENSSSNFEALDAGLQADLQSLLYCKSSSILGHEEHQLAEVNGYRQSSNWWPTNIGFHDRSMMLGSWDSQMLNQHCGLQYDDLQTAHYS